MKLFQKAKDGGPESPVDGYFLIEIKWLFSVVLLHFNPGTREAFHSHAFNAITVWLRGKVREQVPIGPEGVLGRDWKAGQIKYTPRSLMHRIVTRNPGAWAISFRGPWVKTWQEYTECERAGVRGKWVTLTHGRKIVC